MEIEIPGYSVKWAYFIDNIFAVSCGNELKIFKYDNKITDIKFRYFQCSNIIFVFCKNKQK